MPRELRAAAAQALAALAVAWWSLTGWRVAADAPHMTEHTYSIMARATEELQPGALVALWALPAGRRLVEVLEYDPLNAAVALACHDQHADVDITLSLGQVLRGWQMVRAAPPYVIPNTLTDADVELLRTRVDQRGA